MLLSLRNVYVYTTTSALCSRTSQNNIRLSMKCIVIIYILRNVLLSPWCLFDYLANPIHNWVLIEAIIYRQICGERISRNGHKSPEVQCYTEEFRLSKKVDSRLGVRMEFLSTVGAVRRLFWVTKATIGMPLDCTLHLLITFHAKW